MEGSKDGWTPWARRQTLEISISQKKWSNRRNQEGEREEEYPSAKILSSRP
jgi:hypothetical protein